MSDGTRTRNAGSPWLVVRAVERIIAAAALLGGYLFFLGYYSAHFALRFQHGSPLSPLILYGPDDLVLIGFYKTVVTLPELTFWSFVGWLMGNALLARAEDRTTLVQSIVRWLPVGSRGYPRIGRTLLFVLLGAYTLVVALGFKNLYLLHKLTHVQQWVSFALFGVVHGLVAFAAWTRAPEFPNHPLEQLMAAILLTCAGLVWIAMSVSTPLTQTRVTIRTDSDTAGVSVCLMGGNNGYVVVVDADSSLHFVPDAKVLSITATHRPSRSCE